MGLLYYFLLATADNRVPVINRYTSHFPRQLIFYFKIREIEKVYQVNNSVTFTGKPMGSEEFLNQMVEALGITIDDRRSKERTRKRES